MITFPMRPYTQQPRQSHTEGCSSPGVERAPYIIPPQAPLNPSSSTMSTSILLRQPQPSLKRPKLSLQTATLAQPFAPKSANALSITSANPPPASKAEELPRDSKPLDLSSPQASSASSLSSSDASPAVPYYLPIGAHSILRNSPLPPRHVSATSTRVPRRMFPPIKRVLFQEKLVELMPTPIVEESEPSDSDSDASAERRKRRRENIKGGKEEPEEPEDMPATPVQGRWKRKREWVWTLGPLEGGEVEVDDGSSHDFGGRRSPDAGPLLRKGNKELTEEESERIAEERPKFRDSVPDEGAKEPESLAEPRPRKGELILEIPERLVRERSEYPRTV
jgi:hypothetical protein